MGAWPDQRWQWVWACGSGVLAAACVGADAWLRARGISVLAPTRGDLLVSVGLGGVVGLIGLAAAWLMPRSQREFTAMFARLPPRERLRWRYLRRNLLYSGWLVVPLGLLLAWCWSRTVFVLPSILAANAVWFSVLPPWATPSAFADAEKPAGPVPPAAGLDPLKEPPAGERACR
jgi:hypothetical protein